ncbi:DinB family protein [Spongiimicrobium sp. 3-5]|uniref:DinB family protein n=1 Tax=Spongiimicrobium sp. 3-5 TaxID=3332596 RepID=UPI00397FBDD4
MKKTIFFVFMTFMVVHIAAGQNGTQSKFDKKLALDMLKRTFEELETRVAPLTEKELRYIPKDGGWTVLNCLEHLALVEPVLVGEIKKMINDNAPDLSKDLSENDGLIITYITDRTKKVTTAKPFRPLEKNLGKGKEDFLKEIKASRTEMIKLLTKTKADLRHLFGPYPYGEADAYQQFIIAAAHSYRHVLQIQEILSELRPEKTK